MKYGYARVSAAGQELETQLDALRKEGCDTVYSEKITGTKLDRPELQKLLPLLKDGDTVVVTKLCRLARSATDAINTVKELVERGVRVHILNMGIAEDTPMGRLMITIMGGFAEFERDLIVERTQAGKVIARQDPNWKDGMPPIYKKDQKAHALELLAEGKTYKQVEKLTGMSKSTIIRAKRESDAKALEVRT